MTPKPQKIEGVWEEKFDKYWNELLGTVIERAAIKETGEEIKKNIRKLVSQAKVEQRREDEEAVKKLMDKDFAKKLGDNLEIFSGKRSCILCGNNPELQRKLILEALSQLEKDK